MWPARPSAPDSARPTRAWLRPPCPGRLWPRPLSQDRGRRPRGGAPGRSRTPEREGDPPRSYGKVGPSSWSFPCGSRGSAGRCPGCSPPSVLHRPPVPSFCPPPPWSSRQRPRGNERGEPGEGGRRRRRAGAARPGRTATCLATAGPSPGPSGVGGRSEGRAASVHTPRGPEGRPSLASPAASGPGGVESRWAAQGFPWPDSWAGRTFPSLQVHKAPRRKTRKLVRQLTAHVGVLVKCFS